MRETSPRLQRLKYLLRWARLNGVSPKGVGVKPDYSIAYVTPYYVTGNGQRSAGRPSSVEAIYLDGGMCYELGPREMQVAALVEAELEARFTEKGPVWASPDLYDAVVAANDRCKREDVKGCADRTALGPTNAEDVVKWMSLAMELVGSKEPIVLGASGNTIFFFKAPEQEAVKKLAALPDAVRVLTPKKVIVKMLVLRMKALQNAVRDENERRANARAEDAKQAGLKPGDPGHWANHTPRGKPDVTCPEMDSVKACRDAADALEGLCYDARKPARAMREVLDKENLDDETLAEAWNLTLVRNVLEA